MKTKILRNLFILLIVCILWIVFFISPMIAAITWNSSYSRSCLYYNSVGNSYLLRELHDKKTAKMEQLENLPWIWSVYKSTFENAPRTFWLISAGSLFIFLVIVQYLDFLRKKAEKKKKKRALCSSWNQGASRVRKAPWFFYKIFITYKR